MNNKVYYGEYTLRHWIKLMLAGNITLPEYQRHFVWQERDVKRLIQSLKDGQFVQPVTIALYNDGLSKQNIILDGQQRLTSILLAFLGYFPDKKKFESASLSRVASEDDSAADEQGQTSTGILWRFTELLKNGCTKVDIVNKICQDGKYVALTDSLFTGLTDDFFDNIFLGFSYVVAETTVVEDVQKNFSQLFRNINYFGKKLDAMDSRKSLYYQNPDVTKYFEGLCQDDSDALGDLMIIEDLQPCKIDFVRYLSILSQFYVSRRKADAKDVMVGYSAYASREGFYADYVSYILEIEQEDRVDKFDAFKFNMVFPHDEWKQRFSTLRNAILRLKTQLPLKDGKSFTTGYEADYWLFGLIFQLVFEGKSLKEDLYRATKSGKRMSLKDDITSLIKKDKSNPSFAKNANRVMFLRPRLVESCNVFGRYVQ